MNNENKGLLAVGGVLVVGAMVIGSLMTVRLRPLQEPVAPVVNVSSAPATVNVQPANPTINVESAKTPEGLVFGGGSQFHTISEDFLAGLTAGTNNQFTINSVGQITGATTTITGNTPRQPVIAYGTLVDTSSTVSSICVAGGKWLVLSQNYIQPIAPGTVASSATRELYVSGRSVMTATTTGASVSSTNGPLMTAITPTSTLLQFVSVEHTSSSLLGGTITAVPNNNPVILQGNDCLNLYTSNPVTSTQASNLDGQFWATLRKLTP